MKRQILFPVDFSARATSAAPFVAGLARRADAEVVMLHAINRADYIIGAGEAGVFGIQDYFEQARTQLRGMLDGYLKDEFEGIPVTRLQVEGAPAEEIVRFEREQGAWLVMMPTHGLGPFRRFILGSVTAKVLHDAHCPIWTSAHIEEIPAEAKHTVDRVMCAVDFGDRAEGLIRWAAGFAADEQAALMVCHVVPAPTERPERYLDQEYTADRMREAREDVNAILNRTGIQASICIQAGEPAKAIRAAADGYRADLIVIGRGAAGEGGGRLRTHAYSIIREAPVPVISV